VQTSHVLPNSFLKDLPHVCQRYDLVAAEVLDDVGLTPSIIASEFRLVPLASFVQLLTHLYNATGTIAAVAQLAQQQDIARLFMLKPFLRQSRDLVSLLQMLGEVMPAVIPGLLINIDSNEHRIALRVGHTQASEFLTPCTQVFAVFYALHLLKQTCVMPPSPRGVMLASTPFSDSGLTAEDAQWLEKQLGCALAFSQQDVNLTFAAKYAHQPIDIPPQWFEPAPPASLDGEALIMRSKELISASLPSGQLSLQTLADKLSLHPRHVQRIFHTHEISFQQMVNEIRAEHARHLLLETHYDLLTISQMLGFRYQNQLSIACHKWFGQSGQAMRKAHYQQKVAAAKKKAHQKVG
jgi:AraC-like DNA-binding protein